MEGGDAAPREVLRHHLAGESGVEEPPQGLIHRIKAWGLEALTLPARPLPRGRFGHVQEVVVHLGVDEEPPRAEVIHLLRYLGDGILANPSDGDVVLLPASAMRKETPPIRSFGAEDRRE